MELNLSLLAWLSPASVAPLQKPKKSSVRVCRLLTGFKDRGLSQESKKILLQKYEKNRPPRVRFRSKSSKRESSGINSQVTIQSA